MDIQPNIRLPKMKKVRVYTAILTQTGVTAPTAHVLQNTLGAPVTFEYDGPGQYYMRCNGRLTVGESFVITGSSAFAEKGWITAIDNEDGDTWLIRSYNEAGNLANGLLYNTPIEFRAYRDSE